MKQPKDVESLLAKFESQYGYNVRGSMQKSAAWLNLKLGVVSASNANKFVAKKGSATRDSYIADLVGQVCTGILPEINGRALEWGNDYEDAARSGYEFATNNSVNDLLFAFKDDSFRLGCSPDGLVSETKAVEIKCPFSTANYVIFATQDKIKPEYQWQYQFQLWVLEAEEMDFVQFDPRMRVSPLHIITVKRDEKKIQQLEDSYEPFIEDMDKALKSLGIEFGEQWKRLEAIKEQSA